MNEGGLQHYEAAQGNAKAQPSNPQEIYSAYGFLDDNLAALYETASELQQRLSAILSQRPTSIDQIHKDVQDSQFSSELAQRVEASAAQARNTTYVLRNILDRLAI